MDLEVDWWKGGDGEGKKMVGELMSAVCHDQAGSYIQQSSVWIAIEQYDKGLQRRHVDRTHLPHA